MVDDGEIVEIMGFVYGDKDIGGKVGGAISWNDFEEEFTRGDIRIGNGS